MTNKTCSLCGVIFHNAGEMCETCYAMALGESNILQPNYGSQPVQLDSFAPAPEQTFNQAFQPGQNSNPFQSNYSANDSSQSNYQPFPPPENNSYHYSPPPLRPSPPVVESEYKPSIWNWITELPTFAKVGGVVLIFSIIFGFALKAFMTMDVSVVSAPDTEPQKPWFSAWFRSKPTAEEILDKYESVTFAKGKNLVSQNYVISGKAQIINTTGGRIDLIGLKKDPEAPFKPVAQNSSTVPLPNSTPAQLSFPKPWDFYIAYEISVKSPNKMLTKMMLKPKEGFTQSFMAYKTIGFDGTGGWGFSKTIMRGNENIIEEPYKNNNFFYSRTNDGISMTMQRSLYSKLEFVGEEVVINRKAYNIKTTNSMGETANIFFDIETGLATKVSQNGSEFYILDYKNFEGTRYPSNVVYPLNNDWLVVSMEKFQSNSPLDDSIFLRSSYK